MPKPFTRIAVLATLLLAVVLPGQAAAASTPAAHAASRCAGAATSPSAAAPGQVRRAVLCLLNHRRRAHGLGALRENAQLRVAAQRHSRDMARRGYFAHTSLSGASMTDRIRRAGYLRRGAWSIGENIAWGSGTRAPAAAIVRAWMASPGHRANILAPRYREVGIGIAVGVPVRGAGAGATYTTDFGRRA